MDDATRTRSGATVPTTVSTHRLAAPEAGGGTRRTARWPDLRGHLLIASLVSGATYFATALVGTRIESANPAVLTNAFAAAVAVALIMRWGQRMAVAIGAAALAFGLLIHPAASQLNNLVMLAGLAILCALHPVLCAMIARHYLLLRREDVSVARLLGGLLLVGPAMSLATGLLAGCLMMVFAELSAGQILAVLAQWWVVSAILIPLTAAVVVASYSGTRQSVVLSTQQVLPSVGTACFLVLLLVTVRHTQSRDELARVRAQLHDAATQDASQLISGARWIGGLESLLATQNYRFSTPAMNHYLDSVLSSMPSLLAIGWAPRPAGTDAAADDVTWTASPGEHKPVPPHVQRRNPASDAAMLEAVRSGTTQVLEMPSTEDDPRVIYTAFEAAYPPHFREELATAEQRQATALGVVAATYNLQGLFARTRDLAVKSSGQISISAATGRRILTVGSTLQGRPMSGDIDVRTRIPAGSLEWTARFRKRAEIASIADVSPADVALSIISLVLGIGMAYMTLDSVRRRREIEREVQRRTVKLARQMEIRRRVEDELRSAQDQLNSVFASIPIPTLLVDLKDGTIIDCNAAARELTSEAVQDLRGRTLADAALPSLQVLSGVGAEGSELELATPAGTRRYVITSRGVQVHRADATVICFVDITRLHEVEAGLRSANEVLKLANEKANQASRTKSEFVAVMSHEIRTPLNGVIGALDILQASPMRSDQSELVSLGVEAARSLLAIVDDILDFSRIETGTVQLDESEFTLEERLSAAVQCMLPMAQRLDAELTIWVDPRLPHQVVGDELRMQQIVRNLVANALKFSAGLSRRGCVAVRAHLAMEDDGRARVRVAVHDNGIGMSEAAVARLFQPFTQADQSTTRRFGGSGLGLSICAKLAHLMRGSIAVDSTPDIGSVFTLDIPLAVTRWTPATEPLQGLAVEVIGRARDFADDLAASLRSQGAMIMTAASGRDCVTIVDVPFTDAEPLDAQLERSGDGTGVLLLSRNGPRRGELLAPAVVALDRQALSISHLTEAVLMAAGRSPQHEQSSAPSVSRPAAERQLILLVEDNPMNQAVVQRQLEMLGFQVAVAPDGEAGLAMWRQLRPAAILTDLHMPVMDGYGMVQRILLSAASAGGSLPPIIALTADANSEERNRCLAAGMSGYITKPVRAQVLKTMLEKWLASGPQRPVRDSEPKRPAEALQYALLEEITDGDERLVRHLLETFVAMAQDAMQAMQQGLGSSDWTQLREEAHKFKSSARTIGAVHLGELCERLESDCSRCEPRGSGDLLDAIRKELGIVVEQARHLLGKSLSAAG